MTQISSLRPVRRETAATVRDSGKLRPVVVELHGGFMFLRQKGCRRSYPLDYEAAYHVAVKQAVARERREKQERRRRDIASW